jgi:hypothetical protein
MPTPTALPPRFDLQLLGDLCLRDLRTGERIGEPRRKPLAVLAVLVIEAPDTVERDTLLPLLWPELDPPRAFRALAQSLDALRQELGGEEVVVGTTHLTVSPHLTADLTRWRARCHAGDREGCRREYGGPLLEGMHVRGGEAFDRLLADHRARIDAQHAALLAAPMAVALVFTPRGPRAEGALPPTATGTEPPATVREENARTRQARHAARLAATDSSRIGRILLRSTQNVSGHPALDTLLRHVDDLFGAIHESEFAQLVTGEVARRLEREAAEWRFPVTTSMHMARMLPSAGAGPVVRPMLHARGDTLWVDLLAYRSYAHTPATDPDDPNVERDRLGGMTTMALTGEEVLTRARHTFVRFTRSLDRCDPAFHRRSADDAPRCWRSPTSLDVVPGTAERRPRDWSAQGRKRLAELRARSLANR